MAAESSGIRASAPVCARASPEAMPRPSFVRPRSSSSGSKCRSTLQQPGSNGARTCLQTGREEAGYALLADAREELQRLGAAPWLERVDAALGREPRRGLDWSAVAQAPVLPRGFELPLKQRLPRIGSIDQVAVEARAGELAKRSIKKEAKVWALELAIRCWT